MDAPVVAIVQARMGSTRRPGKVLAPALGRPLLEWMLDRVMAARSVDGVLVATTEHARDDPIAELAKRVGAGVFRGSEHDVLGRFRGAAAMADAGTLVRLTGDCPLMDPAVVDCVVAAFEAASPAVDLVTNAPPAGRTYPDGMDVEVFSRDALERADALATAPEDREHVTARLLRAPFRASAIHLPTDLGAVRLTVDYDTDIDRLRSIFEALGARTPPFTLDDVIALLERRGELAPST
jgi:spore coat polysaccharide biosynthesis protein SpsF